MELNVTKTGYRHLSAFMTRRGLDYTAATGHEFPRVAMRDLLRELYTDAPPTGALQASAVASAYRECCCKAACQSNYLLYLEEDVEMAVANAARLGVGLEGGLCRCG